ncbi:MAG TPA: glutathione S-transferase family protein, partial [Acetobacteraceae bacterium]
ALLPAIARLVVSDIPGLLGPEDAEYFRRSREARFGMALEQVTAGRKERLPAFRTLLDPLRVVLKAQPWLAGEAPAYPDYIIAGTLMWPRCVSRLALLAEDDIVAGWFARVRSLFGGLGERAPTA